MAKVNTYLNFTRETEQAFLFYKNVFGGEFAGQGIMRFSDVPPQEDAPALPEEDKDLVMHVGLHIVGGHLLMGTDAPESMGFNVKMGNNMYINLELDNREQVDHFFKLLSEGGKIEMEPADMFWGDYFGSCTDKFGVQWMFTAAIGS